MEGLTHSSRSPLSPASSLSIRQLQLGQQQLDLPLGRRPATTRPPPRDPHPTPCTLAPSSPPLPRQSCLRSRPRMMTSSTSQHPSPSPTSHILLSSTRPPLNLSVRCLPTQPSPRRRRCGIASSWRRRRSSSNRRRCRRGGAWESPTRHRRHRAVDHGLQYRHQASSASDSITRDREEI